MRTLLSVVAGAVLTVSSACGRNEPPEKVPVAVVAEISEPAQDLLDELRARGHDVTVNDGEVQVVLVLGSTTDELDHVVVELCEAPGVSDIRTAQIEGDRRRELIDVLCPSEG